MAARGAFRRDSDTGLILPAFTSDERLELRSRLMHLVQIQFEGKRLTNKEQAEFDKLDRDLFGWGSGWQEDATTREHARMLSEKMLRGLNVIGSDEVVRRGVTGDRFVDARALAE